MAQQQRQQQRQYRSQGHCRRMYGKKAHRRVLPLHLYDDGSNVNHDGDDHHDDDVDHNNGNSDLWLSADALRLVHTTGKESRRLNKKGPMGSSVGVDERRRRGGRGRRSKALEDVCAEVLDLDLDLRRDDNISAVAVAAEKLKGLRLGSDREQGCQEVEEASQLGLKDGGSVGGTEGRVVGRQLKEKEREEEEKEEHGRDRKRTVSRLKSGPLREKDGNISVAPANNCAGSRRKKGTKMIAKMKDENDAEIPVEGNDIKVMKSKGEENKKSSLAQSRNFARRTLTSSHSNIQCKTTSRKSGIDVSEDQKTISSSELTGTRVKTNAITTAATATPSQSPSISLPAQSLPAPSPPFLPDLVSHAAPLLALATDPSARNAPIPFCNWSDELSTYFDIVKIAEASYGEVYRLNLRKQKVPGTNESEVKGGKEVVRLTTGDSVMKVIPLDAPTIKDLDSSMISSSPSSSDPMPSSAVSAVTSEVQLLRRMATVPGFTNFRDVRVVYGRPGQAFIDAWRDFRDEKLLPKGEDSAFPDPGRTVGGGSGKRGRKKMENIERQKRQIEMQLWAVIEMEDAGVDLEGFDVVGLRSDSSSSVVAHDGSYCGVFGVWDIFWNVATALAKGEREARFEHRDLHLGNVCVRYSPSSSCVPSSRSIVDKLDRKLGFTGLETTIIDYTLSRADLNDADDATTEVKRVKPLCPEPGTTAVHADTGKQTDSPSSVAFLDLESDPALFEGDGSVDTQYDFYRYMRAALFTSDPLAVAPPPPSISTPNDTKNVKSAKNTTRTRKGKLQTKSKYNDDNDEEADTNTFKQGETKESPWRTFHPQTNLIWLNFVLGRLMASLEDWQRLQQREAKPQQQRRQKDSREARIGRPRRQKQQKLQQSQDAEEDDDDDDDDNDDNNNNNENDNDDAPAHPSGSSSSSSSQSKPRLNLEQKHTDADADTDTDTDTAMDSHSHSHSHLQAQSQSVVLSNPESKRLDQRARSLNRILRKVQRALDLDALAVRSATATAVPATAVPATTATAATGPAGLATGAKKKKKKKMVTATASSRDGEGGASATAGPCTDTGTSTGTSKRGARGTGRGRGTARTMEKKAAATAATAAATGQTGQASVRSTIELVGWAVAQGWLDLEDVVL